MKFIILIIDHILLHMKHKTERININNISMIIINANSFHCSVHCPAYQTVASSVTNLSFLFVPSLSASKLIAKDQSFSLISPQGLFFLIHTSTPNKQVKERRFSDHFQLTILPCSAPDICFSFFSFAFAFFSCFSLRLFLVYNHEGHM